MGRQGEAVGGIVVVRHGADTREVIAAVKARIEELRPQLPEGVTMETAYDRTGLIDRAVGNLASSLRQQFLIVGLVSFLFLFHVGGGVVAMVSLPLGILIACIVTRWIGVQLNIMSLGGVAVAVGTMVDAGIVLVENTPPQPRAEHRPEAALAHRGRVLPRGRAAGSSSRCW